MIVLLAGLCLAACTAEPSDSAPVDGIQPGPRLLSGADGESVIWHR